ncbi:MAG: DUF234 domain-containing protein, partial [bacterium]
KNVLIDEFGKDYGNYFSILSLIASSKNSRSEIESVMEMPVGGFLDRLENEYGIIKKIKPILAKPGGRVMKYQVIDPFLNFWFRFIYKYRSAIEIDNLQYVKEKVLADYETYSGKVLERFFTESIMQEKQYSMIGSYWERNNQNEIDIVVIDENEKQVKCYEVKRNPEKISLSKLKEKSKRLREKFQHYTMTHSALSLNDMP